MKKIENYELPKLKIVGPSCRRVDTKPLDNQELGLEERKLMLSAFGESERLDYPTLLVELANGKVIEVYDIPEKDREKVFRQLYLFDSDVSLDDVRLDIHANKLFYVRDFLVTREGDGNFLVSPYYPESGGTLLDWVAPDDDECGIHVNCIRIPKR